MDWGKAYRREQKATWADIAESIRYSVSMAEVLRVYSPETPIRGKRCPCPLHNGKDYNMSFTATNFHCFVCGERGDVIEFVMKILNLPSRSDAMKRMNGDLNLGLPIGELVNAEQAAEMSARRQAAMAKQREREMWNERYNALLDEYVRLDKIKTHAEPFTEEWTEAAMSIDRVSYELDNMPPEPR